MAEDLQWSEKLWHPFGKTTGSHGVAFYKSHDRITEITRYYNDRYVDSGVRHYVVHGHYADSVFVSDLDKAVRIADGFNKLCNDLGDHVYVDIRKFSSI